MVDQELERALAPVAEFHKAQVPTVNTVLAAYLRAEGVAPVGAVWHAAKKAFAAGADFAEAARTAAMASASRINSEGFEPDSHAQGEGAAPQASTPEAPIHPQQGNAETREETLTYPSPEAEPPRNQAQASSPYPHAVPWDAEVRPLSASQETGPDHAAGSAASQTGPPPPVQKSDTDAIPERLTWFPKVNGPGDIDGTGAAKLLGTPNVPLSTVLVRETAQNSWDARLGGARPVRFSMNLRRLSDEELGVLREVVFASPGEGLELGASLSRGELWVLEVSDRGTLGLGGPVRNDLAPPLDSPTNYIDLVLNVGAPRDVRLGGGTYGFGKTISYRVSRSGTVLIWSRSHEPEGIEDRLIGSAIGPSFDLHGKRYTGRHWWGVVPDGGERVEPVRGPAAAALGRSVFQANFEDGETGTSLMIIDPDLGGDDRETDVQRLVDAVIWNLWPKLVPNHEGLIPMPIEVLLEGEQVEIPRVEAHPALRGFVDCLQLVRATQTAKPYTPTFNTEVFEIRSERPKKLLGHLAISRYPYDSRQSSFSEIAPVNGPMSHVAWMRHDAELVVRYDARAKLDTEGIQWAAVFKPVEDVDDAFAEAEPPAHDHWVPESITDRTHKSYVRVAIRRMRDKVQEFLAPTPGARSETGAPRSAAALGDALAGLVGATRGSAPSMRKARPRSTSRTRSKPAAKILEHVRGEAVDGKRELALKIAVSGTRGNAVSLDAKVGVAVEGARYLDPDLVRMLGWTADPTSGEVSQTPPQLVEGGQAWLVVEADEDVAVQVDVDVKEDD